MRACILVIVLAGCDDNIVQAGPDLSAAADLAANADLAMTHGCSTLVSCESNCGSTNQSCSDACYDATTLSGKALLQTLLDCLAGSCTTQVLDGGGTACSTAEGTALQDPRNAGTVQLSPACEACVRAALTGTCSSQEAACLSDKS
jgi:hypothetical protein